MHDLWTTHDWKNATQEQVIAALFDAPEFPDPRDMGDIKRLHPKAIVAYQSLFYGGAAPHAVTRLRQRRIGI